MISLIAARAANGVIGNKNKLPWHLPEDLVRFRLKTKGHPVIMGFNTFISILASLGQALPGRPNFVLTKKPKDKILTAMKQETEESFPGINLEEVYQKVHFYKSIGAAIQIAEAMNTEVFVIGGQQVYKEALPDASTLYLTEVHQDFEGDVWFPDFNSQEWPLMANTEENRVREYNGLKYSFATYKRSFKISKAA